LLHIISETKGVGNIEFKENGGWEWLHVALSQCIGIEFDKKKSPSSPKVGGRMNQIDKCGATQAGQGPILHGKAFA
jgi:hypothetical protein